jgi:GT2 family glycosyltransferase
MNERLPIVIPTFNRCGITKQCVISLFQGTHTELQIILCDSDSTDGTRDCYSKEESISVLNVGADAWWTGAVNRGIAYAISQGCQDYVLILNDDIDFPPTLVEQMLLAARQNPGKIISPAQKSITGLFLGMTYSKLLKNFKVIYADQVTKPTEVQSTNGCCLLIPIDAFKTIGLFDEVNCPQLAADVEFQIRAGRAGFPTLACPGIVITQHPNTNYHRKLKIKTLLTYAGSPVHLAAYLTHGRTLFNGSLRFAIFGLRYHYRYAKSLLKAVYFCLKGTSANAET